MTTPFNPKNLHQRQVITPDGIGTFWGVNDKKAPTMASVTIRVEGYKVPQTRVYDIEDLEEVK